MLTLVLADTELELVPAQAQGHPAVRSYAKKRGRSPASILLDSSFHHPALKKVPDGERRGRPDIAHIVLVTAMDSILNLEGRLRVFIHTRNDDVIQVAPETRVPKNYTRFVGLIEDLFEKGEVPEESPLFHLDRGVTLKDLLGRLGGTRWAFAEDGETIDLGGALAEVRGDLVAMVGGFPHGGFRSPVREMCDRVVAIHRQPLKAWTVVGEVLVAYRNVAQGPQVR